MSKDFFSNNFKNNKNMSEEIKNELDAYFNELNNLFGQSMHLKIYYASPEGVYERLNKTSKQSLSDQLKELENKLQIAIEKEEFEEAAKLRDEIKDFTENYEKNKKAEHEKQQKINELNQKIKQAVEEENFEQAAKFKKQRDKMLE